ncbi:hypothetical protein SEUCBS139899_004492 [Sporothrix eucalyptigena]
MGCCFSRSEGPNSPYPGGAPSASARAINIPPAGSAAAALAAAVSPGSASSRNVIRTSTSRNEGADVGGISSSSSTPSTIASQRLRTAGSGTAGTNAAAGTSSSHPPPITQEALSIHINKPIRRRRWTSRNRAWTRHSIDRERTDFFDTRVTGRAEIWQTLHAALEILWEADLLRDTTSGGGTLATTATSPTFPASPTNGSGSAEIDEARATAQTILDAADITLPTGDMAQGAYDAFGNFYALPAWIVSDPTNLDNDPQHNSDLDETKGTLDDIGSEANLSEESDEDDYEEDDDEDGENTCNDEARQLNTQRGDTATTSTDARPPRIRRHRRREEKGKAVVAAANQVAVRARLSATSRDVVILLGREETVRSLAHRISEEAKLPHKTRIRIAYLGKILKDGSPLLAQGWKEGHVVNALVFGAAT